MGWLWLAGLFLALVIIYYVVVGILLGIGYFGMAVVIVLDFFSYGATILGISSPGVSWLIIGTLIGSLFGLGLGCWRAGRATGLSYVIGAGLLLALSVSAWSGTRADPGLVASSHEIKFDDGKEEVFRLEPAWTKVVFPECAGQWWVNLVRIGGDEWAEIQYRDKTRLRIGQKLPSGRPEWVRGDGQLSMRWLCKSQTPSPQRRRR